MALKETSLQHINLDNTPHIRVIFQVYLTYDIIRVRVSHVQHIHGIQGRKKKGEYAEHVLDT